MDANVPDMTATPATAIIVNRVCRSNIHPADAYINSVPVSGVRRTLHRLTD